VEEGAAEEGRSYVRMTGTLGTRTRRCAYAFFSQAHIFQNGTGFRRVCIVSINEGGAPPPEKNRVLSSVNASSWGIP
jgi:hypothetical protein